MSVSLKVPVALLLKNAQAKLAEAETTSTAPQAAYELKLERWRIRAVTVLNDFVQDVYFHSDDEDSDTKYRKLLERITPDGTTVNVKVKMPKPPERPYRNYDLPRRIERIKADIKLLQSTSQTDLTVRAGGNFSEYL